MYPASAVPDPPKALAFRDGLGDRFAFSENATGVAMQMLCIRPEMADAPAFEFALRERALRLAGHRHEAYTRVIRIQRHGAGGRELAVISEHVEGLRLSALLRVAEEHRVEIDLSSALSIVQQLLEATSWLHQHVPGLANGLIAPERLIVTPRARVVITDHVLGLAIEQLQYRPERLWRELRIAARVEDGAVRFSHRTDVLSIGLVALALVLGRPLRDEEFPRAMPGLLDLARERSALGYERPLASPLRDWMIRALQLNPRGSFASATEAAAALDTVIGSGGSYLPVPMALERFLYTCTAALIQPVPMPSTALRMEPGAPPPLVPDSPAETAPDEPGALPASECVSAFDPDLQSKSSAAFRFAPGAGSDEIDWSTLANQPGVVATAGELTELLAGSGTSRSEEHVVRFDEPAAPRQATPQEVLLEPMEPMASLPMPVVAPAEWGMQSTLLTRPRGWLRLGIACGALLAIGAGLAAYRAADAAVVAASGLGPLVIDTKPAGLPVVVDGIEQGLTPARLPVAAGEHVVEVHGPEGSRQVSVTVAGGAVVSQYLEFGERPQPVVRAGAERAREGSRPPAPTSASPGGVSPHLAATASNPAPGATDWAWGWLEVKSASVLEIKAGGRTVGRTGGERIRLREGRHEIELVDPATDYRTTRVIHVVAGKVTGLSLPPPSGTVNVNAAPWAEVWIGNRRIGETPLANVVVPAGRHEVTFRHPELGEKRQVIVVSPDVPVRLSMDMR